jgi:hypothetical protein
MNTKRALVATALAATVVGLPAAALANVGGFDDVPDNHTHAAGIGWLVDNDITSGCDADSYCPSDNVSRAQMGTFFHRLSGNAAGVAPSVNATAIDGLDSAELVRSFEVVSGTLALDNDTFENVSVACPAGKAAVGGGYQIQLSQNGAISEDWFAGASRPTNDGLGWVVSVRTLDGAVHDAFVTVTATCAAI